MRYSKSPLPTVEELLALPPGTRRYYREGLVIMVTPKEGRSYGAHRNHIALKFRYEKPTTGKWTEYTLGHFPQYDAQSALTEILTALQPVVRSGKDPVKIRREKREATKAKQKTFGEACTAWIDKNKSDKQRPWSESTLRSAERYCFQHGKKLVDERVGDITANKIREALEHLFGGAPVQAHRARAKFKSVLDYAEEMGWRQGPNPARKELHRHTWPSLPDGNGFADMPSEQIPALMQGLRQLHDPRADAVQFLILTATRRDETRLARWEEINLEQRYWTVPKARAKQRRPHRIPLSDAAVDVLKRQPGYGNKNGLVFPRTDNPEKPLRQRSMLNLLREIGVNEDEGTLHGFRKSFKNWTVRNRQQWDLAEMCLAHLVGTKTAQVYSTEDALEERRPIMEAWAEYCESAAKPPLKLVSTSS